MFLAETNVKFRGIHLPSGPSFNKISGEYVELLLSPFRSETMSLCDQFQMNILGHSFCKS